MKNTLIDFWAVFSNWLSDLSAHYGVDPFIFGFFYIGLAPVVWVSAALFVKAIKNGQPATFLVLVCVLTFLSPYFYVMYAGENLPIWIYLLILVLSVFGLFNIWQKIRMNRDNISVEG